MDQNIPFKSEELIEQLKQKNSAAVNTIFDEYAPALYTVILQIIRNEELSNTVLEKVFSEIVNEIERYDVNKESLFIWMYKIARNTAIDVIRSKNHPGMFEGEEKKTSQRIASLEIDNYGLKKVIMKLKDEQRILLELCYYKGYTYEEIAEALNIPVETVNKKLRMAVLDLRAALM